MKTFKLLIASLVVFGFLFTTNVNAQEKWGKSGKYEIYFDGCSDPEPFFCPCAGEYLQGNVIFQMNKKGSHQTIKGHLVGVDENCIPSGNVYNFSRVDHINTNNGLETWKIKTVRRGDGLVTNTTVYFQDGVFMGFDENCK